jgi:hypothetical protein
MERPHFPVGGFEDPCGDTVDFQCSGLSLSGDLFDLDSGFVGESAHGQGQENEGGHEVAAESRSFMHGGVCLVYLLEKRGETTPILLEISSVVFPISEE